jgi:SAM-dependent methyltransferase
MNYNPQYFDTLFSEDADPWRFQSRWYEERKRELTLACLPHRRFAHAYEPGCAIGELTASLAQRCDHLLASDGSAEAVQLARSRLADLPGVEVEQAWVPEQWPERSFDLVVISELAYFLPVDALDPLADRILASLEPGGVVLGCHWRWPIEGCALSGDQVQARLAARLALPQLTQVVDADFRLDVWCRDPRSVAQREGFV